MVRTPCCVKNGLKKGPWTPDEDQKLVDYIQIHGYGNWRTLPKNAGLERCGKSCRLRWTNYLRPDIKRGRFSFEEEEYIIHLHSILGNKWSTIASRLPGRTDNEIKNYWNTCIRKKLLRMGIDPITHSPRLDLLDLPSIFGNSSLYNNNTSSTSQINMARLLALQQTMIASSLSSSRQNPDSNLIQHFHKNSFSKNPQMQKNVNNNPINQSTQIQTPIQNPIPSCTTITTTATTATAASTTSGTDYVPLFDEPRLLNPNIEQYPTYIPNLDIQNIDHWQNNGVIDNNIDHTNFDYYGYDQTLMNSSLSNYTTLNQNIMSYTSSSSPTTLNSSSNSTTYVYNNGNVDEKESYCSEFIKFEIPDFVDINQFILAQTN